MANEMSLNRVIWRPRVPDTCELPVYGNQDPVYYKSEEQLSPPAKRMRLQDDIDNNRTYFDRVQEQSTVEQPAIDISVVHPDGAETPLQDLQELQQDGPPINPVPSFESISTFTGISVPTQRCDSHDKNRACHLCNKTFNTSLKLNRHIYAVHPGEKLFVCNMCSKGFRTSRERIIHVLTQTCIRTNRHLHQAAHGWYCITCNDVIYPTREEAVRHACRHETGKGMSCPVCNQNFQKKSNTLIQHVKKQHPDYLPNLGL